MIEQLTSKEIQSFVDGHQHDDPNNLFLKYKRIFDVPVNVVVDQILGRKKAREKLPTWYRSRRVIYPPSTNLAQSSSEKTASQKIKLLQEMMDKPLAKTNLLDLTGGFGVDSFFFSRVCKEVHFAEPENHLLNLAQHNHEVLGASNIQYHNQTAEVFLDSISGSMNFDVIYIDPDRRSKEGQRLFKLNQCEPNVVSLQEKMWQFSDNLLIKISPLLDIKSGLKELQHVKKVCVVSVHNECKELLFFCERNFSLAPVIEAINLTDNQNSFSFSFTEEEKAEVSYADPLTYLYEPNASILKAGAFRTVGARFNLFKLHPNTHLYTSDHLLADFPGKIFKVESFVKSDSKALTNFFEEGKANIVTRNYPLSVDALRKKMRLKDGGQKFLIGCSGMKKKFLLVASKLNGL